MGCIIFIPSPILLQQQTQGRPVETLNVHLSSGFFSSILSLHTQTLFFISKRFIEQWRLPEATKPYCVSESRFRRKYTQPFSSRGLCLRRGVKNRKKKRVELSALWPLWRDSLWPGALIGERQH